MPCDLETAYYVCALSRMVHHIWILRMCNTILKLSGTNASHNLLN